MKRGNHPNSEPDWLTKAEAAERLSVSLRTLERWIARGLLPAARVGSLVRISREQFESFKRRAQAGGLT